MTTSKTSYCTFLPFVLASKETLVVRQRLCSGISFAV